MKHEKAHPVTESNWLKDQAILEVESGENLCQWLRGLTPSWLTHVRLPDNEVLMFVGSRQATWKVNGRVVDPSSLKGAIQRFAPRFSGYNQEDSQEFLRYLLEGLHEDVNRVTTRPAPINTEIDTSLR